ncbi:MAG: hypothetical protein AAF662_04400 [Pseudomonadota bacterium]
MGAGCRCLVVFVIAAAPVVLNGCGQFESQANQAETEGSDDWATPQDAVRIEPTFETANAAAAAWGLNVGLKDSGFDDLRRTADSHSPVICDSGEYTLNRDLWNLQVYEAWNESAAWSWQDGAGEPPVVAVFVVVERGVNGRWSVAKAMEHRCEAPRTYTRGASILNGASGPRFLRVNTPINGGLGLVSGWEDWFDLHQGFRPVLSMKTQATDAAASQYQMWVNISNFRLIPGGGPEHMDRVVALGWGRLQERHGEALARKWDSPWDEVRTRQGLVSWVLQDGVLVYDEVFSTWSETDLNLMGRLEFFDEDRSG